MFGIRDRARSRRVYPTETMQEYIKWLEKAFFRPVKRPRVRMAIRKAVK